MQYNSHELKSNMVKIASSRSDQNAILVSEKHAC